MKVEKKLPKNGICELPGDRMLAKKEKKRKKKERGISQWKEI